MDLPDYDLLLKIMALRALPTNYGRIEPVEIAYANQCELVVNTDHEGTIHVRVRERQSSMHWDKKVD